MSESMEKTMRMRTYVLKEILKTEKDYVETLHFLVHVFMERLQKREDDDNDKFIPPGTVVTLLSNVVDLYKFHQEVLVSIQDALGPEPEYSQQIGNAFLKHKHQFEVYAPYCSNHERAQKRLNELTENEAFQGFILGCLLLGNYVNDVSMEGFLLTPIQRICKYPLLLRELMKKTPNNHPDYEPVRAALELMKEVCSNVNETKRQLEQLEKLEDLQASIANWEGANLTDMCTRLIKQGPLIKISAGNIQKRHFFLFDHLLVYCAKSSTFSKLSTTESMTGTIQRKKVKRKKSNADQKKWLFKGRIATELMEIENLEDGASDFHCYGNTVNNGWKVLNAAKNKWFVLYAETKEEKDAWLNEFIQERERKRSKTNVDQRDPVDVLLSRGKKIYYKATHQGLIRDRKSKMRNYPKSLLGNEFVNWLLESKEENSIEEAVILGQALLDCGIIHHVQDKHHFRNESVLYRFRYDDGTFKARGENQDLVAKGLRVYCRIHCSYKSIFRDKEKSGKSHPKFDLEARKLIDWLIDQGDCQNREEASIVGQSLCESGIMHHVHDKQDFKDDSSMFKFFPDEEYTKASRLPNIKEKSSKQDFKFPESFKTKTLLLLNVYDPGSLGLDLKFIEDRAAVVITSIIRGSPAQVQGFNPGMRVLQINNDLVTACPSQEYLDLVLKHNMEKHKMINFVVKSEDHTIVSIPVTKEGMGFQIRGSNPCVVHAVAKGGMAMNHGLVKGHAIMKVNNQQVNQASHDDVAAAIREGCKLPPPSTEKPEEETTGRSSSQSSEDDSKMESTNSLTAPGGKSTTNNRRQKLALLVGISHTSLRPKDKNAKDAEGGGSTGKNEIALQLTLGNRHLERFCVYHFNSTSGIKTTVVEKMSEAPSIFDLAAQLLEVLTAEDEHVLADVQALEEIAPFIADVKSEVFERRRSLRYEVIQERLESYKRFKRHLTSYMWPSYKQATERAQSPSAKDFCPTNCHVNLMTVSQPAEKRLLRGLGLTESKDGRACNVESMVHTTHATTCLAAPSFRTAGKNMHGLLALQRGVEGNTELMDSIRQLMVALDHALLEMRQGQSQLIKIINSQRDYIGNRNSYQSNQSRSSYNVDGDGDELPTSPTTPQFYLNESPNKEKLSQKIKISPLTPDRSDDSLLGSDMIQTSGSSELLNTTDAVSSNGHSFRDSGHGDDENDSDISGQKTPLVKKPPKPQAAPVDLINGNESESDSGIHSNRGSMVGNDKLAFTFSTPSSSESQAANSTENQPTELPGVQSSSQLLTPDEDPQLALKSSSSMPSLPSAQADNNKSPVKMRTKTARPTSRVRFSGRDRISLISTTESTCSSDGTENMNYIELDLSPDALDKLQGTMEYFRTKVQNLTELVKKPTIKTVFDNTQDTTPTRMYCKMLEGLTASTSNESIRMALARCYDPDQFSDVINTLVEQVEQHINEVRTQLVLALLLHEDPKQVSRRDKVFSQSLITAITSFATQLRCAIGGTFNNMKAYGVRNEEASRKWLEQCMSIGACVMFQTTLNPNEPVECAMLEDSYVGVYDLERVSFYFKAITGDVEPNECPSNAKNNFDGTKPVNIDGNGIGYSMEGNRCSLKVYFHLDKHVFIKLPPRLQAGGGVKIIPVLLNHGLQDLGNMLYKQDVTMNAFSNSINEKALSKAYDYYKKFRAFHLDRSKLPRDTEARAVLVDRLSRPLNALDDVMTLMETNVKPRHGKSFLANTGCGVLPLAAEFCQRLGACSVIGCANGVFKSTVCCTLQQALILSGCHGMAPKTLLSAAHQMASHGARSYAKDKNPHARNRTSLHIPRLYRGNYGDLDATTPT